MNLSVGIVGLPNAGKSTLFNALLKKQQALAANYPFATIEPNVGIVPVPDPRLEQLAGLVEKEEGKKPPIVPATIEFVDIAGLVKGASKGEGLGNKFLSHIREVDVIINVIRFFEDTNVSHVMDSINPERDKEIIETELILADLQTLEKQTEPRGSADKETKARWELIKRLKEHLNTGKPARDILITPDDIFSAKQLNLLTAKPVLYVLNVSEQTLTANEQAATHNLQPSVVVSARIEEELSQLAPEEQAAFLAELHLHQSGLDRVAKKAYELLGLLSFLTAGIKEVRAWTIKNGWKAPQAAGVIHTDFEKNFIKAEVIALNDYLTYGSRLLARQAGKTRLEGKDYIVKDGDVIEFKIGQ